MTTREVEYHVGCLSGPGRKDAYETPIPIPLARFQSSGLNAAARVGRCF